MFFKFRAVKRGAHIQFSVFVGADRDSYALSGILVFRPTEYQEFVFRVLGVRGLMEFEIQEWEKEVPRTWTVPAI